MNAFSSIRISELSLNTFHEERSLQTHHVYSTLKRRRNDRFHVVSTWNTHGLFVGFPKMCESLAQHQVTSTHVMQLQGLRKTEIKDSKATALYDFWQRFAT